MELLAGALGGILVAALLIFLLWQASTTQNRSPDLRVAVIGVTENGGTYKVRLMVHNEGGHTAANAMATSLIDDGATVETSQVTLQYIPPDSASEATLLFSRNPESLDLQLRAVSYQEP